MSAMELSFQKWPFATAQVALGAGIGPYLPRGQQPSIADVPAAKETVAQLQYWTTAMTMTTR